VRILVCNDDGIDSPGLAALEHAAGRLGEVWVVAPERKWTAASHRLSFDQDLVLERRGPRRFACSGAPADCVIAAMTLVLADERPGLVLSGVNHGRNTGEDLAYSGTLAIAREATFWGVPAIGFSRAKGTGTWDEAELAYLADLIAAAYAERESWAGGTSFLSINLPVTLPAAIVQATMAADKIASAVDILAQDDERTTFRLRRGRTYAARAGDQNERLDAGCTVVARFDWAGQSTLPAPLLARLALPAVR
jgi:5'-nucleotidase